MCLDQITQLCDLADKFSAVGAQLSIIGSSSAAIAAQARERLNAPFPFLADPDRVSYQAANLRKDWRSTFNWRTLPAAIGAFSRGHRQGKTKGDPFQQGGVLVIDTDGTVILEQVSRFGGDHAAPERILAALEASP